MASVPETVLGHWSTLVEGLQASPTDFYQDVEQAVVRKTISDLEFERIEYREGGAFSGFRPYLRVRRYREVFDICGAPFGNGFFFSWWFAEVPVKLPALVSTLIVLGYMAVAGLFMYKIGVIWGPVVLVVLVPIILALLSEMGKPQTDDVLLSLPYLGKLYAWMFRPLTYYRIDTSLMFQKSVQAAVMEVVDRLTDNKGIRALSELERKPVMRDFFRK